MSTLLPIAIDASRSFNEKPTGTENYSDQIIRAIASADRQRKIRLYCRGKSYQQQIANFLDTDFNEIKTNRLWSQFGLMSRTWVDSMGVLFIPAHVIPVLKNPMIPTVITTHDIRTEFLPQHSNLFQKIYLNTWIEKLRGKLATHIIAVSKSTKSDLINQLGIDGRKISVIYEGVDQNHFSLVKKSDEISLQRILKEYHLRLPFFIFVSTIQPRKNLVRIIQGFGQIANEIGHDLLIIGKRGWMADEIYALPAKLGLENRVRFLDYVKFNDLPYLYALAEGLVYPSLYEGFGLPILEAYSMGTKVLTSNVSSMPEVGGDLAIYVDPYSVDAIAIGMKNVISQRMDLEKLKQHLTNFTWDKAGQETYNLLNEIAAKNELRNH